MEKSANPAVLFVRKHEVDEMQEEKDRNSAVIKVTILLAVLASGFLGTFFICAINHTGFGMRMLPLIICIDAFVFSSIGFFLTEGKTEKIYGFFSILNAACLIVQMAVMF